MGRLRFAVAHDNADMSLPPQISVRRPSSSALLPLHLIPRSAVRTAQESGDPHSRSDAAQLEYGCVDWYMYAPQVPEGAARTALRPRPDPQGQPIAEPAPGVGDT